MNKKEIKTAALALGLLLAAMNLVTSASGDSFDVLDRRETVLSGTSVDMDVSPDGKWTFVLTEKGEVAVYDAAGILLQTITVGGGFDRVVYDQPGNRLLLGGSGRQELRVISLSMRYDIDDSGSPVKGARDAPVTIAVYNDYQ